jgi:uncharacterized repeat protein (TIGR01451 family)
MKKTTLYMLAAILCFLLSACGGGGGGGGGGAGGDDDDGDGNSGHQPIPYTGNQAQSPIDASNAGFWIAMALGGAQDVRDTFPLSTSGSGGQQQALTSPQQPRPNIAELQRTLAKHAAAATRKKTTAGDPGRVTIQAKVNETYDCDNGTIKVTGKSETSGLEKLKIEYIDCEFEEIVTDGVVRAEVFNLSDQAFNADLEFETFRIYGEGLNLTQDGAVSLDVRGSLEEDLLLNLIVVDELTASETRFTNFSSHFWWDSSPGVDGRLEISGRIYDSILGYVDYTTEEQFLTNYAGTMPPDYSGRLRIAGANGAHVLVEVGRDSPAGLSPSYYPFLTVSIDSDNDASYEIQAVIPRRSVGTEVCSDFEDTDGDGMHNGWETGYGLNPADPADADDDTDGDLANNLLEYSAGFSPVDPESVTFHADVSMHSITVSGTTVNSTTTTQGDAYRYNHTIRNNGEYRASNITVIAQLPAGVTFHSTSISTPSWTCAADAGVVTCTTGSIFANSESTLTINVVAPMVSGIATYSASVSSDNPYDFIPGNNSDTREMLITAQTDLAVTVDEGVDYVLSGDTLNYLINVGNNGPHTADEITLTGTLPAGISFTSIETTNGECTGGSSFSCTLTNLASGSAAVIGIEAEVTASEGTLLTLSADVATSGIDNAASNNSTTHVTPLAYITAPSGLVALVNSVPSGSAIGVTPGTYTGSGFILGSKILFSTAGPETTIIDASTSPAVAVDAGQVIGFTFSNCWAAIRTYAGSAVIKNNIFINNSPDNISGVIYGLNTSPVIDSNIFKNNCPTYAPSSVLLFSSGSKPLIINNVSLDNNCASAVELDSLTGSVINNTFVRNKTVIEASTYGSNHLIRNNIMVDNETGVDQVEDNLIFQNNLLFGNTTDYLNTNFSHADINGNISADPLFVDEAGSDFHLQTGSPAIDAATNTGAPELDFDGNPRPVDGNADSTATTDIGAFELQ